MNKLLLSLRGTLVTKQSRVCTRSPRILLMLAMTVLVTTSAHAEKPVDKIVAVVNQDVITLYDLDRAMAPVLSQIRKAPNFETAYQEAKQKALEQLVDNALLRQEIENSKIEVTDTELARAIQGVLTQNHISIDALKAELGNKGITFDAYKKQVSDEIRRIKFMQQNVSSNISVSDEELDHFLKEQRQSKQEMTVRLEQWSAPLKSGITQKQVGKEIHQWQKQTDALRKGKSIDEKEFKHESVGPIVLTQLPSAVAQAVRSLVVGAISDPIATVDQIYIVKLLDKQEIASAKTMSREQASEMLYNDKVGQELSNYLTKLRQKSYIDVRE